MIELKPNLALSFKAIFTKALKFSPKMLLIRKRNISSVETYALSKLC